MEEGLLINPPPGFKDGLGATGEPLLGGVEAALAIQWESWWGAVKPPVRETRVEWFSLPT